MSKTIMQESKLFAAIAKQNALLVAARDKKHPDFAFLLARDVLVQQAQCWLSLARIRRLTVSKSTTSSSFLLQPTPLDDDALLGSVTECLAHARRIYFDAETGTSKSVAHGRVLLLVEEAEVLVLRGLHIEALATYDQAIQLCSSQGDHATESLVDHKLEALRLELDTWAKLDQLTQSPQENASEREILRKCFDQLTSLTTANGSLHKEKLAALARDLGAQTALSEEEVDEIWQQLQAHEKSSPTPQETNGVGFDALWRWWMAEEMYDFRSHCMRRH